VQKVDHGARTEIKERSRMPKGRTRRNRTVVAELKPTALTDCLQRSTKPRRPGFDASDGGQAASYS
jgi:hypothetical protein